MEALLKFENISLAYQSISSETNAIENLSFNIADGEFVAIVGPSGCGKSSILSMAAGLISPTSGIITLNGKEVKSPNGQVGYMLQRDHLFEWRNILQNALLGLQVRGRINDEDKNRVLRLLKTCGLYDFRNKRPSELSGGMRQRAALIRTLAIDPKVLLLDEPFSALDYQTRLFLCDELSSIIRMEKKTALFVTHDIAEAISIANRVLVLSQRPATLKLDIKIDLKSATPLARRNQPGFQGYFDRIWKEMDVNAG